MKLRLRPVCAVTERLSSFRDDHPALDGAAAAVITFTEGIDEPLRALVDACRANSISPSRFRTLAFGQSLRIPTAGNTA